MYVCGVISWILDPDPYPLYSTRTCICKVTITLMVCDSIIMVVSNKHFLWLCLYTEISIIIWQDFNWAYIYIYREREREF